MSIARLAYAFYYYIQALEILQYSYLTLHTPISLGQFNLNSMSENNSRSYFRYVYSYFSKLPYLTNCRFTLDKIYWLAYTLAINQYILRNRYRALLSTKLYVLIYILVRLESLAYALRIFCRSKSQCSLVFNNVVTYIYQHYAPFLYQDKLQLTYQQLGIYARSIENANSPSNIQGFVNRTLWRIARLLVGQEMFYTRQKYYHVVKYQTIVTPNRLISHLSRPYPGLAGDWTVWQTCGIID